MSSRTDKSLVAHQTQRGEVLDYYPPSLQGTTLDISCRVERKDTDSPIYNSEGPTHHPITKK